MTGESASLTGFRYDAGGTACLDTIQDFISTNNPDGLSTRAWKDRFWQDVLGMEHTQWGSVFSGDLRCGSSAEPSCRDLARAAQLWANEGEWPGAGADHESPVLHPGPPASIHCRCFLWQLAVWLHPVAQHSGCCRPRG